MKELEGFLDIRNEDRNRALRAAIRICCSKMSLPLYLVFWLADWIYVPERKWVFLALRGLLVPVNLFVYRKASSLKGIDAVERLAVAYAFANSLPITAMIYLSDGIASPYYAGLNLVALGSISFFDLSDRYTAPLICAVYAPYLCMAALPSVRRSDLAGFVLNLFFIVGTVVIGLVIRFFNQRLKAKEILARMELAEELRSREAVIRAKTEEALRLNTLTKQFSPQVVHAITEGRINLLASPHRAKICAIFIDIVNSTDRVVRLNEESVAGALKLFMEDTMKVLLRHDITIDKFQGDGVLAFSNDPVPYDDYRERVVRAALEIRERIRRHRELYFKYWLSDFRVRIGIASGYANVGFYGSDLYFKSYTGIGPVMNLASRLCGSAEPEQILISRDVMLALKSEEIRVRSLGERSFKGFEGDAVDIYEAVDTTSLDSVPDQISTCPKGHGILHLDVDRHGAEILVCRTCSHSEDGGRAAAEVVRQASRQKRPSNES